VIPEDATLEDLARWLRNRYPDAVSVNVFVNYESCDVEAKRRSLRLGEPVSMRRLDGMWCEKL